MIKKIFVFAILIVACNFVKSQTIYPKVLIKTIYGDISIMLYDDTPMHSDNFVKLVKEGFYNDLLFHRVISNFMIQTGDPDSKNAEKGKMLGRGGVDYTIPPEIRPQYYHKKGSLSAARMPDHLNPNKESSGCQFYIVQGQVFSQEQLDMLEKRGRQIPFTEEQKSVYKSVGGAPHLDYEYTVFGIVTEGYSVLDRIANMPTDKNDRPIEDIIIKVSLIKK